MPPGGTGTGSSLGLQAASWAHWQLALQLKAPGSRWQGTEQQYAANLEEELVGRHGDPAALLSKHTLGKMTVPGLS